jgi:hypothetical protein
LKFLFEALKTGAASLLKHLKQHLFDLLRNELPRLRSRAAQETCMQITVHLRPDIARNLAERSPPANETKELTQILSQFDLTLAPLHPGTDDPELTTQYWLQVPDQATADQVIEQLLSLKATQAAYLKPPDAMP